MNLKGNLTSKSLQGSIVKSRMHGILGTNPSSVPITVDNELSLSSTNPVQNRVITAAIKNRLWSDDVKTAILQIAQKVAYIDADGQDYYDALYDALYPPVGLDSISAVFDSSATIYDTDTLDTLKQYLTVTAFYSDSTSETVTTYTLSGSMDAGTQTITVSYGGKTTTFTVTIITLEVVSITAAFAQGSAVIYDTDSLDTLKQYLVVTATYSDSTTDTVTDYTLSGTLAEGTSTITVSYGGKTDTFDVATTVGFLYTPDKGKLSDQPYVSVSGELAVNESVSNGVLNLGYTYNADDASKNKEFSFQQVFPDEGINGYTLTMRLKIIDIGYATTTNEWGSAVRFLRNGVGAGRAGLGFIRYGSKTASPKMRWIKADGGGTFVWGPDFSLNNWHTVTVAVANGVQTVMLDGVQVATEGVGASPTSSKTSLNVYGSNSNNLSMQIEKIEIAYIPV